MKGHKYCQGRHKSHNKSKEICKNKKDQYGNKFYKYFRNKKTNMEHSFKHKRKMKQLNNDKIKIIKKNKRQFL